MLYNAMRKIVVFSLLAIATSSLLPSTAKAAGFIPVGSPPGPGASIAFGPQDALYVVGRDMVVYQFDWGSRRFSAYAPFQGIPNINSVAVDPKGNVYGTIATGGMVYTWQDKAGLKVQRLQGIGIIDSIFIQQTPSGPMFWGTSGVLQKSALPAGGVGTVSYQPGGVPARSAAFEPNGTVWAVNGSPGAPGQIFRSNAAGGWDTVPAKASGVAFGGGKAWIINESRGVSVWNGTKFAPVCCAENVRSIATDSSGNPWVVLGNGSVMQYKP
jgi:hypothetical protein